MCAQSHTPEWVLLDPLSLPPASDMPEFLGAIIANYENPYEASHPRKKDLSTDIKSYGGNTVHTSDEAFGALQSQAKRGAAKIRLSEIVNAFFSKTRTKGERKPGLN
jgi:hypothetical protein